MRVVFKKRSPGQIEFGIIFGGITLGLLCAGRLLPVLSFAPACAFRRLTGLPCPTCGSTRSLVYFAHGEFAAALLINPLMTLGLAALLLFFLYSVATWVFDLPRIRFIVTEKEQDGIRAAVVILLLAQWFYLIHTL